LTSHINLLAKHNLLNSNGGSQHGNSGKTKGRQTFGTYDKRAEKSGQRPCGKAVPGPAEGKEARVA
jgi:hypothetical protein